MSSVRDTFGLACPKCGSDRSVNVQITTWVRLHPDGTDDLGDHEWTATSPCVCTACDTQGTVSGFTVLGKDGAR